MNATVLQIKEQIDSFQPTLRKGSVNTPLDQSTPMKMDGYPAISPERQPYDELCKG